MLKSQYINRNHMNRSFLGIAAALALSFLGSTLNAQIINAYGRKSRSLNGEWHAVVDPFGSGKRSGIWKNRKPAGNNEFREYSFDEGLILNVPGDFNSQLPELKYYEGTVWYGRYFDAGDIEPGEKVLLYFAGVANEADVYLNAEHIGHHEGGFTPFQIDVTDKVKDSDNFIAVAVDNRRTPDKIPAMNFDWWNYGGITRDVMLIQVPDCHIEDYFVRLDKEKKDQINIDVELSEAAANKMVSVEIPELGVFERLTTGNDGRASKSVKARNLVRWDVDNPKLYEVRFATDRDTISEQIGFRNLRADGSSIVLNDRPVFLCGVNIHEEVPQRKGRAFTEADAAMLLSEAKSMGANFVRLAHYPQNEHMVRMAEKMGILLWEEIPVWQSINFANDSTLSLASQMMSDMINRDKNRAAIAIWSIANETWPSEERNNFLTKLKETASSIDDTRLIGAAFNNMSFNKEDSTFYIKNDPIPDILDVVGINEYVGWYVDWQAKPENTHWKVAVDKPLIISEFGAEALYGQHGNEDAKWSWSEDFQAKLYRDNLTMFQNIPNLAGTSPWVLFDFRSPTRMSPQQGLEFNRKGLVSDRGQRKAAWHIMRDYYRGKSAE